MKSPSSCTSVLSLLSLLLAADVSARSVPQNVQNFYNRVKSGKCTGGAVLKDGFYSEYPGPQNYAYCKDNSTGVLYLHGSGSNFANMDIDCDGRQDDPNGRCKSSGDTQPETAFKSLVQQYSKNSDGGQVTDLDANFTPYVVFGNQGHKAGYTTFHPQMYGVKPLSVMAVVCGDKLVYGVWGDTNGDDGKPLIGEASIALGTACYGDGITGNNGHDANDVLYIAFPGTVADTVNQNADWAATSFSGFENSIEGLGDKLISKLS